MCRYPEGRARAKDFVDLAAMPGQSALQKLLLGVTYHFAGLALHHLPRVASACSSWPHAPAWWPTRMCHVHL